MARTTIVRDLAEVKKTNNLTAYGFKPWHSGLCFIAALIGAFIGIFVGGHFSDWIADRQTERNGDVREREMRLPAILVSVVIAPLALILYGVILIASPD
ncbi:hypothetical protein N0V91_005648 [Didymella pomorum]|uniref:Uncharacterized protein n=1 Tax=Didymella pomorum TaxID=749634 RepID=A0A9W8ZCM5_9PLEO|nr:hypothetical protein N0V91_005648 [Didymella pomorum]